MHTLKVLTAGQGLDEAEYVEEDIKLILISLNLGALTANSSFQKDLVLEIIPGCNRQLMKRCNVNEYSF